MNNKYKGVLAYFENDKGQPIYEYNKFNSNLEEQDIWKKEIESKNDDENIN